MTDKERIIVGSDGRKYITTEPQIDKREWQGLTDKEVFDVENAVPDEVITDRDWCLHFARAIEDKLKEKNT